MELEKLLLPYLQDALKDAVESLKLISTDDPDDLLLKEEIESMIESLKFEINTINNDI